MEEGWWKVVMSEMFKGGKVRHFFQEQLSFLGQTRQIRTELPEMEEIKEDNESYP